MESAMTSVIKRRLIQFDEMHPDPAQAHSAAIELSGMEGIIEMRPLSPLELEIAYHLLQTSLERIEEMLTHCGFHLDGSLMCRLRRALYYFTEETERANHGCPRGRSNCTDQVFVNRYSRQNHDCRDHRPEHWRQYL